MLVRILACPDTMALTWFGSIEKTGHLRYVLESLMVNVAFLTQLLRILTCQLEGRIATQRAAPMIEKDREGEFPLLDLCGHHIVHLVFDQLRN